ncbi:MAG: Holliday junction branch migration protein RuvA [Chlamydiota bacterium]
MLEHLKGKLFHVETTKVIVDVQGVGYRIGIPISCYSHLPKVGEDVLLYVSLVIREEAHTLYGFLQRQDRDLFELLLSVSGVGPKTALSILSHFDIHSFTDVISHANVFQLSKVPGIGKKTAEKLILEMKDKVKFKSLSPLEHKSPSDHGMASDAISALMNLGYHPLQAQKAIKDVLEKHKPKNTSELITLALRKDRISGES